MRQRAPDDQEVDPNEIRLPDKPWYDRPIKELLNPLATVTREEADRLYADVGNAIKTEWETGQKTREVAESILKAATTLPKDLTEEEMDEALKQVTGMQKGVKSMATGVATAIRDFSIIETTKHAANSFKEMWALLKQGVPASDPEVVKRSTDVAGVIMSGSMFGSQGYKGVMEGKMALEKRASQKSIDEHLAADHKQYNSGYSSFKEFQKAAKANLDVDLDFNKKGEIIAKHGKNTMNFGKDIYEAENFLIDLEYQLSKRIEAQQAKADTPKSDANALKAAQLDMLEKEAHQQHKDGLITKKELEDKLVDIHSGKTGSKTKDPSDALASIDTKDMSNVHVHVSVDGNWTVSGPGAINGGTTHQTMNFGKGKAGQDAAMKHHEALAKTPQGGEMYALQFPDKADLDLVYKYKDAEGNAYKPEGPVWGGGAGVKLDKKAEMIDEYKGKMDDLDFKYDKDVISKEEYWQKHAELEKEYAPYLVEGQKKELTKYPGIDPTAQFDVQLIEKSGKPYGGVHKDIDYKGLKQYQTELADEIAKAMKGEKFKLGDESPLVLETQSGEKFNVWYKAEDLNTSDKLQVPLKVKENFPDSRPMESIPQDSDYQGPVIGWHSRRRGGKMDEEFAKNPEAGYKFDIERSRDLGIHFGTKKQADNMGANKNRPHKFVANLEVKNTLDMGYDMFSGFALTKHIEKKHPELSEKMDKLRNETQYEDKGKFYKELRKTLTDLGYDSVRYWNMVDDPNHGGYSYIVWEPGYVKSGTDPSHTLFSNKGVPITPDQAKPNDKEGWLYKDFIKPFMDKITPDWESSKRFKAMQERYWEMLPEKDKKPTSLHKFLQFMDENTNGQFKYAAMVVPGVRIRVPTPIAAHHTSPNVFGKFELRPLQGEGSAIKGDGIYLAESTGTRDYYKKVFEGRGKEAHRYDVNIHAKPDELLHMDLPVGKQGHLIKQAFPESMHHMTGLEAYNAVRGQVALDKGLHRYGEVAKATSELFANRGLVGAKFLDKYSRPGGKSASNPTHNYVIWVPEALEITKRYVLPGTIAGGGSIPLLRGAKSDDYQEEQ